MLHGWRPFNDVKMQGKQFDVYWITKSEVLDFKQNKDNFLVCPLIEIAQATLQRA